MTTVLNTVKPADWLVVQENGGELVFNVATAKDKKKAAAYEGATLGANIAGGVVAGAAAGLVCGPGAVVCSSVLVIAGGALGALGMGYLFDWVWR